MDMKQFIDIIESPLESLIVHDCAVNVGVSMPRFLQVYRDVIVTFLKGDSDGLQRALGHSRELIFPDDGTEEDIETMQKLAELRWQIRKRSIDRAVLADAVSSAPKALSHWKGELAFVTGMCATELHNQEVARDSYLQAFHEFERIGAKRKAIKSLQNSVAAESRINPNSKRLISDYFFVYRRARKLRVYGVAGVALYNISREYQREGAFAVALKQCNQALVYLEQEYGTLQYFSAIVHRCHLLIQMGRKEEAGLDYEIARSAPFPEIREALRVLPHIVIAPKEPFEGSLEKLLVTWKNRLENAASGQDKKDALSPLEAEMIRLIGEKPLSKFELIEKIYGVAEDFGHLENRFKALLGRLRKKRPALLVFEDGKYRLSDVAFVSNPLRKAV